MTEDTLRLRLQTKLTEQLLRESLTDATDEDDRGHTYTDIDNVARFLADWLAQECCDENWTVSAGPDGHP